jgi:hypothetical protein
MTTERAPMSLKELEVFMKAGKADFTLINRETNEEESFKLEKRVGNNTFFVSARKYTPGKMGMWDYIGLLSSRSLIHTKGSKVLASDRSFKSFTWILRHMSNNTPFPKNMHAIHNGKCGCCGRRLKDDKSLKLGYGPSCYKQVRSKL